MTRRRIGIALVVLMALCQAVLFFMADEIIGRVIYGLAFVLGLLFAAVLLRQKSDG